jgi:23S rRNA (cytidine1920-2'-O)/16S rRNA (cytidine1409-2'-O)-methyltransferase
VTLDLSFISVLKVMPAVAQLVAPGGQLVVLVKPQFEAGRSQVGSGGVVKDPKVGQVGRNGS